MLPYAMRRMLVAVPTLFVLVTLIFLGMRVVPGGPAIAILGDNANARTIAALEAELGLDRPLGEQYLAFLGGLARGDLGKSLITGKSIAEQFQRALPYTIDLALMGTLISLLIGLPVGIISALRQNTWVDYSSRIGSLVGLSIPDFLLGVLLLIVFAVYRDWFPVMGGGDISSLSDRLYHVALPAFTLGLSRAALVTRLARSSILETKGFDYLRTARAKGLMERTVFYKHALRNALIPITTVVGVDVARAFGGAIVLEMVFTRPGVGSILIGSIAQRDYPAIQSAIMIFGLFVILANLAVDLIYAVIDPRIRYT